MKTETGIMTRMVKENEYWSDMLRKDTEIADSIHIYINGKQCNEKEYQTKLSMMMAIYEIKVEKIQNLAYAGCWATLLYTLSLTDKNTQRVIQKEIKEWIRFDEREEEDVISERWIYAF